LIHNVELWAESYLICARGDTAASKLVERHARIP
jgi:hypothetical protein